MRSRQPRDRRGREALKVTLVIVSLISVTLSVPTGVPSATRPAGEGTSLGSTTVSSPVLPALLEAPPAPVSDTPSDAVVPGSEPVAGAPDGPLTVLVSFAYANESRLQTLLQSISDSGSPEYHHYLSAAAFDAAFSPPSPTYRAARDYFASFGVENLTILPDRMAISFQASAPIVSRIFHDPIGSFRIGGREYVAPTGPALLPAPIAPAVLSVEGLGTAPARFAVAKALGSPLVGHPQEQVSSNPASVDGYLAPPTVAGTQMEYAPDLQVAYDERSLFAASGYPTNTTVATILWSGNYTGPSTTTPCGELSPGQSVGPWYPADIESFFQETLPPGEPSASTFAVPLDSAPAPSCLASWDSSGAAIQNTIDLETLGSTAPGAQIYTVYGPNDSLVYLDQAFTEILSPPSNLGASVISGLENVSVISNAWAIADQNDSTWFADLEQAQARGITVLAASGDSGDDLASLDSVGTNAEFPASMAFNTFGDVAVGGTTLTLTPTTLRIAGETAWWISPKAGGPEGSSGGISSVFHEPKWQLNTSANRNLSGNGRGDPDLAAVANNTLLTVSVNGLQYLATNASNGGPFYAASGTGIAVSVVAGLVAEIDHTMRSAGVPSLGFLSPSLYHWASLEDSILACGTLPIGTSCGSPYTSPLPTLPTHDVTAGSNDKYFAERGWDLVTGWGSLDAYNYTVFVLNVSSAGAYGHLDAVLDRVDLTGLKVTSTLPKSLGGGVDRQYNASIQQNVFLADSLGAPIYWVQNVVYLHHTGSGWAMNFTGWVSYPFWGLYPNVTVFEWWIPAKGHTSTLPLTLNLTTQLVPGFGSTSPQVQFSFGVKGSTTLVLPVPGAAYIIGSNPYTYSWQGLNYTNGPRINTSPPGFLAPQFALVGAPGGDTGNFMSSTNGTVAAYVEPSGSSSFELADSSQLTLSNRQTGEVSSNLSYGFASYGHWTFGYHSGSSEQGILEAQPARFTVEWDESGSLPSGTTWFVNLSTGGHLSAAAGATTIVTQLQNGSYNWTVATSARGWAASPTSGTTVVNGAAVTIDLKLALTNGSVTFTATGPTFPFRWFVNITGGPSLEGTGAKLSANLTYGSYSYRVATSNLTWSPTVHAASFTIGAKPAQITVQIVIVTYVFKVIASYPPNAYPRWTVTVGKEQESGAVTVPLFFSLWNGSFSWSVSNLTAGYAASPSSGSITVKGPISRAQVIVITHSSGPGGLFGLGVWGYVLVGGIAVAAILALVVVIRRRKPRRPRPERPRKKRWVDPDEL